MKLATSLWLVSRLEMCGLLPSLPSLQNVVSQKTLLRMQYHAMRTKCWTTFAGISDKLIGCCKEELTTDGVVVALSFCLSVCFSARPTQAPPYLTPLCVLHIIIIIIIIFVNCSWVVTRWQYTFTHKNNIEQHFILKYRRKTVGKDERYVRKKSIINMNVFAATPSFM